jgi:hypothetical protein
MTQGSHSASAPSRDDIFVGAILLGGGGEMCGVGKRTKVPVHESEEGESVEMIERNDADVDWMRFGGEKGWTSGLCTDRCQSVSGFFGQNMYDGLRTKDPLVRK